MGTSSALKRMEKDLAALARQQAALCERLECLEQRMASPPADRDEVVAFLDRFGTTEGFGGEVVGAWIAVCRDESLEGGLRTIQQREAAHARLCGERIKELGGSRRYELPDELRRQGTQSLGGTELSDLQKLELFTAQLPEPPAATRELEALADRLGSDRVTQSLLRSIAEDECASVGFLLRARGRLREA